MSAAVLDRPTVDDLQSLLGRMSCTQENLAGAITTVAAFSHRPEFSDVHGIGDVQDELADALIAAEATYVGALRDE